MKPWPATAEPPIRSSSSKQAAGLAAVFADGLADLAGKPVTEELKEEIVRRLMARCQIADQIVEEDNN